MPSSRTLTLTAAVAAFALTFTSVPAHAATISPTEVADAYSVMLTSKQAKLVGIGKQSVSNFDVTKSTNGTPDAPRLCDLSGDVEVKGKGAEILFQSEVLSLGGGDTVLTIAQETHWYPNRKKAKQAYDDLVQKIKKCEGRTTPVSDDSEGNSVTITTTLTNGEKKAPDGDSFLWANSETVLGDPTTNFADHDYVTMRLFANFIQIIELDSEGNNAAPLTKKQIAAADRLTDSLGDAWQEMFM